MGAFDRAGQGLTLAPPEFTEEAETFLSWLFDGLSNAVYRAGLAQRQDEHDTAIDSVFGTLDTLETRLKSKQYLFGEALSLADLRLFGTLIRFDTVYATHFRCTRKRLVDYPSLWRFTRQIYQIPCIRDTVDFDDIRVGYYLNDGDHNPHNLICAQPEIDWDSRKGLDPIAENKGTACGSNRAS